MDGKGPGTGEAADAERQDAEQGSCGDPGSRLRDWSAVGARVSGEASSSDRRG